MKYNIITNPNYTNRCKIGVELTPKNDIVPLFFSGLSVSKFDKYILSCSHSNSFGFEDSWVTFYEEMDWEEKSNLEYLGGINENEVNIYLYDGKSQNIILKESLFNEIMYAYGIKLLEVYQDDKTLPSTWAVDIQQAIEKLKLKIDKDSIE